MSTELFAAIASGDRTAVERLLERDRSLVDARDTEGTSPILAALKFIHSKYRDDFSGKVAKAAAQQRRGRNPQLARRDDLRV